jgi:hypothetical protein
MSPADRTPGSGWKVTCCKLAESGVSRDADRMGSKCGFISVFSSKILCFVLWCYMDLFVLLFGW